MRIYTVHIPRARPLAAEVLLIREGFNWPAAGLTVLWALWHRLWVVAALLFIVGAGLNGAAAWIGLDPIGILAIQMGYAALIGFGANDWRRQGLTRRGYRFAGVAMGNNLGDAEMRYFMATETEAGPVGVTP